MNIHILKIARLINVWLYRKLRDAQRQALPQRLQTIPNFHALSPINDADADQYVQALKWALDNSKEKAIHNIALTGPYGSGKSSILKTFKERNKDKKYQFLEISLATFKEENPPNVSSGNGNGNDNNNEDGKNEDILRLIELSILQQIFYHEEDNKIPDSRFKKIKSFNRKSLYFITLRLLLAVLFGVILFYSNFYSDFLKIEVSEPWQITFHFISLAGFLIIATIAVFKSVKVIYGLRISKFKFKETEIEIDKEISKSILNNHLDEILYFFEVTEYSVVIIEDLDRFRQSEIFTKLRELNLLINNCKKIKDKQVIFIYAVRDEMFQNKDRTKFFDFIIPVIPVVNSYNSKDKLSAIVRNNNYPISNELVEEISLFIDDMRLLYNITNEYGIYSGLLDPALDRGKLLAMLVYKNIYPDDFVLLAENEGKLYKLLNKRIEYIRDHIASINENIKVNKKEIEQLHETFLKSANELRMLYVSHFVSSVERFGMFEFKGTEHSIIQASGEEAFEYFKKGNFFYYLFQNHGNNYYSQQKHQANFKFEEFQNKVDPSLTYQMRLANVESVINIKEERLKEDNSTLEKEKSSIRHLKLQEILADHSNQELMESNTKQEQLLSLLLRNGYIDEDYLDYISLFYEGSITKNDRAYVLNVKSQISNDFDAPLTQIPNILKKLRPTEFKKSYILNYSILDYILTDSNYEAHLGNLLDQFGYANDFNLPFVDGYMTVGTQTLIFINRLLRKSPEFWKYIRLNSDLTKERKDFYFREIIANVDLDILQTSVLKDNLVPEIITLPGFLSLIPDSRKTIQVIITLEIIFKDIILEDVPQDIIDLVIEGCHYEINDIMVKRIIISSGRFDLPLFEQSNYKAILDCNLPALINYVEDNIEDYIEELYLNLPHNQDEQEEELLLLYNNKNINLDNRIKIIKKSNTKISRLTEIEAQELDNQFYTENKILQSWENLIDYYHRHQVLDGAIVGYLNIIDNARLLSQSKIEIEPAYIDLKTTQNFLVALINMEDITDNSYSLLMVCVPYHYDLDEINRLNRKKMTILIDEKVVEPTPVNFNKLKERYPGLHNKFLDQYVSKFVEELGQFEIDEIDLIYILSSEAFNLEEKIKIISALSEEMIISSEQVLKELQRLMVSNYPLGISKNIMISVLTQNRKHENSIQLFNMYFKNFMVKDVVSVLNSFPAPYNKIGEQFTSILLDETEENRTLADNLKEIGMISSWKSDKKGIKLNSFKRKV